MKFPSDRIEQAVTAGLLAIVVVAPTQYGIELVSNVHLCLVDPLVWLVLLLWGIGCWQKGTWRTVHRPPLPALLFVALAVVSLLRSAHVLRAAKDVIQFAEYFLAAYLLFANGAGTERRLRALVYVFLGVATAVTALGLIQYFRPGVTEVQVCGSFGNRSVFGGFLALTLPLFYGLFLCDGNPWRRAWFLAVVVAGLVATLAGGTLVAVLAAGVAISAFRGQLAFVAYGVAVTLLLAFGLPNLPRNNTEIARQALVMYGDDALPARRYVEWQAALAMAQDQPLLGVGIGGYQENVGQYLGVLPNVPVKPEADSQNLYLVLASSMGSPALLCFLGMLALFARRALAGFFAGDSGFHRGLALGLFGSLLAFSLNAVWAPLIVRGIGVPLAFIAGLTAVVGATRRP